MRESCPWFMPQDEARSMIQLIEAKIRTSDIEVRHRDALVRLRSALEEQIGIEPPVVVAPLAAAALSARLAHEPSGGGQQAFTARRMTAYA